MTDDPTPHDALLEAADARIVEVIAVLLKNGGTTTRVALLIFDPSEMPGFKTWPPELIHNGKIVLIMPSTDLAKTLAEHWRLAIDSTTQAGLEAPTSEGVVRCVTVVKGVARPIEMSVPNMVTGGEA